jgi:hypothetical protein
MGRMAILDRFEHEYDRMIFDGDQLSDLMAPLDLGWKAKAFTAGDVGQLNFYLSAVDDSLKQIRSFY